VIELAGIDHVSLRVTDVAEAAHRWGAQFGLTVRARDGARARLACDDEPFCLELVAGDEPGLEHVAYELRRACALEDAQAHLEARGVGFELRDGGLRVDDLEGNGVLLVPHRERDTRPAHARPAAGRGPGHPRRLGHVNFLTARIAAQLDFYVDVLGMSVTDWLGEDGVWLHVNADHHVMALMKAVPPAHAHFHHLALDVVDIGQMRAALDHLGRHGRWLGWGPARHGVGGNIAAYVRIVEEECFVELYCDMEQLGSDHEPRTWPDDRFSSNTWGPLPPRTYFRFDADAVDSERESREMLA
jgi:catechol 2,3-dioxygenase-like lactoylglutathione lyase family enzyme